MIRTFWEANMTPRVVIALVGMLATACGGGDSTAASGASRSVAGSWNGVISEQALALVLSENNGTVTGTGTISNTPTGVRALTVSGSVTTGVVNASLTSGTAQPINLQGTLSGDVLTATLSGSGFTGDAISLYRAGSTIPNAGDWPGTYRLSSVEGQNAPVLNYRKDRYVWSFHGRTLTLAPDGTGEWQDSTTTGLFCALGAPADQQCNASGRATVVWRVTPASTLEVVRSTHSGYVQRIMTFTKPTTGTIVSLFDLGIIVAYRK